MSAETVSRQEPRLNLDINGRKNFIQFHSTLGSKPKTTIRIFDRTDCYTVHGDDCETIAKIIYNSTAFVHNMLDDQKSLTYVTFSKFNFEMALRELLLIRNYRVEVYQKRAQGNDWHVEYRGSPGNLIQFEDILFFNKELLVNNTMLSIQLASENCGGSGKRQQKIGIAAVDQNDCLLQLCEFVDDDFFRELEATIVLLSPRECLLPSTENEFSAVKAILERNGVMISISKKKFSSENSSIIQDLNCLLCFGKGQEPNASALPELNLSVSVKALQGAIQYLELTKNEANFGHYTLKQLNLNRFVHLDGAAVSAINLLPPPGRVFRNAQRWQSVYGLLDNCRTPQGHRLLMQWITQPLRSLEAINDRHNCVQCFLESPTTLSKLHEDYMKRIPDILMLTKKLMRRKTSLRDIFRVYQALLRASIIVSTLQELENSTIKSLLCDPLQSHLEELSGLKQMVEQFVDFDCIDKGEYLVKASVDEQLNEFKQRMSKLYRKMENQQVEANADLNLERGHQVRLENVLHLGYHFRVVLKAEAALRKNKKYITLDVVKSGVRFTTEKMREYSKQFEEVRDQYESQQASIVEKMIDIAVGYFGPLMSLNYELAQLDCLISFAIAAQIAPTPYIRPQLLEEGSGELKLKNLRHPCLEIQEHVTYIPNDLEFNKNVCNMLIITGPNMGGKSTFIRSVGVAVLMAHVGSFVPCSEATIPVVDCILGRIGSSDNIAKGLSTFMVEMIETSGIVRVATENSLVIIDELGRGTSTYEGCGIAWSIAQHLAENVKCLALIATHFHEITQLATAVPTVQNYHMSAVIDDKKFTLLYKVCPGAMEKSFGIQIAQLADFPLKVIQDAQEFYKEFQDEHANKKTAGDDKIFKNINDSINEFVKKSGDCTLSKESITALINRFRNEIEQHGESKYFKSICEQN